jgi:hypothetical protein
MSRGLMTVRDRLGAQLLDAPRESRIPDGHFE